MTTTSTVTLRLIRSETVQHRGRRSWGEAKALTLPTYDVLVNGEKVGSVERTMVTREAPRARGSSGIDWLVARDLAVTAKVEKR